MQENTKIFLGETTREKIPQNFLSIELDQDSVKNLDNSFLLLGALLLISLSKTSLSEWVCVNQMKSASLYLYSFIHLIFDSVMWASKPNSVM